MIYDFLNEEYYPDYNWGPELFDFYREEVEQYGSIPFYINDSEAYIYYEDGTLEIMPFVSERLNEWFNDAWSPVFKDWFEKHSGLEVIYMVDSANNTPLLKENIEKNKKFLNSIIGEDFENRIEQITSSYDMPMVFDNFIYGHTLNRWLNHWGPMYLFHFRNRSYLYQDRGVWEWFMDDRGWEYTDDEIIERLGIKILGLRFSDILDMYFKEED